MATLTAEMQTAPATTVFTVVDPALHPLVLPDSTGVATPVGSDYEDDEDEIFDGGDDYEDDDEAYFDEFEEGDDEDEEYVEEEDEEL